MAANQQPPAQPATKTTPQGTTNQNQNQIQVQKDTGSNAGLRRREPTHGGSPFAMMRRMFEDMDRMFEDFGRGLPITNLGSGLGAQLWNPEIDVFERDGNLIVRADLPGLQKDDIKIDVTNDQLILQGERKYEHNENRRGLYQAERGYGTFYRAIPLPDGIAADTARANFNNGVLQIELKLPENKNTSRRLEIQEDTTPSQTRH